MSLTDEQRRRYARHIVLPECGEAGQMRLLAAHVAVIGCGGLGSIAAGYLAAMGIGHITLADHDRVELSNLARQILFETADIGQYKTTAAAARLQELNPDLRITEHRQKLDASNAAALISGADIVVDASDNFPTRIIIHHAAYETQTPLIYAAISGLQAMLTTFTPYLGAPHPCLHCFMPIPPTRETSCAQEGILGPLAGVVGSMQALEAAREILGLGSLSGTLLRYDAHHGLWQSSSLPRDLACAFCNAAID